MEYFKHKIQYPIWTGLHRSLKFIRKMIEPYLDVDEKVKYRNFGYIPSGSIRDIEGKLFGHANLLKRLQAKDVMKALNIKEDDIVLDFGCGSGYFTVEMAKLAQKSYGIDINDYIETIKIPEVLRGRLEFIKTSGTNLPFPNNYFDLVLASEVLPMIYDPTKFLSEINRVLKPDGCLVILNGAGHPIIRDAFKSSPLFFRVLKKIYSKHMPRSYEEYCLILLKSFRTAQDNFLNEENVRQLLMQSNFDINFIDYTPGFRAGAYLSWLQFLLYLRTGRTLSQNGFVLKYYFFTWLQFVEKIRYRGGILCSARKRGKDSIRERQQ